VPYRVCVSVIGSFLIFFQQPVSLALGCTLLIAEPKPQRSSVCVSFLESVVEPFQQPFRFSFEQSFGFALGRALGLT
jgi:hypothetical protein